MEPHLPKHWVAGVYKDGEWYGEFAATADELMTWCQDNAEHDYAVEDLVLRICECQLVYEEWWERVQKGK